MSLGVDDPSKAGDGVKRVPTEAMLGLHALTYDDAPVGYVFTLPDGTFVDANATFLSWIGRDREEMVAKFRLSDVLAVGSRIYYETHYAPLLRMQGRLNEVTLDLRSSDGRSIPVLASSNQVEAGPGTRLVRTTFFNISERRKYEDELVRAKRKAERAEERLRFVADAGEVLRETLASAGSFATLAKLAVEGFADACTIDLRVDGRIHRVASAHRVPEKNALAGTALESLPPPSGPLLFVDTLEPGELEAACEELPSHATLLRDLEAQSVLVAPIVERGRTIGALGFYVTELGRRFEEEDRELAREIAQRAQLSLENAELAERNKRIQAELQESHEWFSTTLHSIGDAVMTVDLESRVTYLNPVAERMTGWSAIEARGLPLLEVFRILNEETGEPAFNPVAKVLADGCVVGLANHTILVRKDGKRFNIEDSASPIRNFRGEMTGVVLVFHDSTEKHADQARLRETLARLESEREIRERFVATLTHDLRSPMTAVRMSAQLILRRSSDLRAVESQAVRLVNSINRADQMIQDLLDANRIRAGEPMPLELARMDLSELVVETLSDLVTIHGDRFLVRSPARIEGEWSAKGLRRVIENLCNNAVKYGEPHAPIEVDLSADERDVRFSVRNRGPVIPAEELATIFEPYRRAATAGKQKGWGLGLTLVRGIVESHGGRVRVESTSEGGTLFEVTLPRPKDSGAPQGPARTTENSR